MKMKAMIYALGTENSAGTTNFAAVLLGVSFWLAISLCSSAQTVSALYSFKKNSLSQSPQFVTPAQGRDGSLYGTTSRGETGGTVFRISTKGLGAPQLFAFSGTNGSQPFGGVT